jgi:catechol 2,3-dioxygenase-like lactoylglutathione lyase family enzyme
MAHFGDIRQIGYLTDDIERSMQAWVQRAGVGPFTWYRNLVLEAVYLGEPTRIAMEVGIAYRGDVEIELIQQTNDAPSPYREFFRQGRMGLHHLAYASRDIDGDLRKAREAGFEVVCTIDSASGRYAYFRDPALPENLFEFLAVTEELEQYTRQCMAEARDWDGSNPIRVIDLAPA